MFEYSSVIPSSLDCLKSKHNLKKIFLMVLKFTKYDLSKPRGRFFQILCVSQKVRTLPIVSHCLCQIGLILKYRESSPYANFITAIFITVLCQNIPEIFGLCVFWANSFITTIFISSAKY